MPIKRQVLGNSKVTRRFQITIPKSVRDTYHFEIGDLVLFIQENGKLTIERIEI